MPSTAAGDRTPGIHLAGPSRAVTAFLVRSTHPSRHAARHPVIGGAAPAHTRKAGLLPPVRSRPARAAGGSSPRGWTRMTQDPPADGRTATGNRDVTTGIVGCRPG